MTQRVRRFVALRAFYVVRFIVLALGLLAVRLGCYVNAFDGEED
jgi:hypothetical protein